MGEDVFLVDYLIEKYRLPAYSDFVLAFRGDSVRLLEYPLVGGRLLLGCAGANCEQ